MKTFWFAFLGFVILSSCNEGMQDNALNTLPEPAVSGYDPIAAKRYGADEIGMKKYVMAFLKAGPNRDQDSATAAKIQEAHMANIRRMADEGLLVLAGPFFSDGELRGIYLFNVTTLDSAKALTNTDPAVQSGRLVMDLQEWYGSAALMAVDSIHRRIAKKSF